MHPACPLLAQLSAKQGEEATMENLTGVAQKAISLKIYFCNHSRLTDHISNSGVKRDISRLNCLSLPHT
jgi:hypothetical protein